MPLAVSATTRIGESASTSMNESTCSTKSGSTVRSVRQPAVAAGRGPTPSSTVDEVARISARPLSMPTGLAPARQNLTPLYCAGLCDAVNIAPGRSSTPAA